MDDSPQIGKCTAAHRLFRSRHKWLARECHHMHIGTLLRILAGSMRIMCFAYHDDCTLNDCLYYALRQDITRWVIPSRFSTAAFPTPEKWKPMPAQSSLLQTGRGKLPAQAAISVFSSLMSAISPPATLLLKSFSLFASFGSFPWTSLQMVMHLSI